MDGGPEGHLSHPPQRIQGRRPSRIQHLRSDALLERPAGLSERNPERRQRPRNHEHLQLLQPAERAIPVPVSKCPRAADRPPYYQDQLVANVKSVNTAYFIQDSVHPVANVTVDLGLRFENQTLYDFQGNEFLSLNNFGPRLGVVYDPSNEGRSKVFAHYGRSFETIPLNLAARYFGGEGIAVRHYDNTSMCTTPIGQWTATGHEWTTCQGPASTQFFNAGSTYPVQPKIKAQYHDEIVAGFHHALTDDLVVGADYTHRWLGGVIEDGSGSGDLSFVLGNPGDIPPDVLTGLQNDIDAKQKQVDAAAPNSVDMGLKADRTGGASIQVGQSKGPGRRGETPADLRRPHAVGGQADVAQLDDAGVVYVLAAHRKLQRSLRRRQQLLRAEWQQLC